MPFDGMYQAGESLDRAGGKLIEIGKSLYEFQSSQKLKDFALEDAQAIETFKKNLALDPDHGTPLAATPEGYAKKWADFQAERRKRFGGMSDKRLASRADQQFRAIALEQDGQISGLQLSAWGETQKAGALNRINKIIDIEDLRDQEKSDAAVKELDALVAVNLITKPERDQKAADIAQSIRSASVRKEAVKVYSKNGYSAALRYIAEQQSTPIIVNGRSILLSQESVNSIENSLGLREQATKRDENDADREVNGELARLRLATSDPTRAAEVPELQKKIEAMILNGVSVKGTVIKVSNPTAYAETMTGYLKTSKEEADKKEGGALYLKLSSDLANGKPIGTTWLSNEKMSIEQRTALLSGQASFEADDALKPLMSQATNLLSVAAGNKAEGPVLTIKAIEAYRKSPQYNLSVDQHLTSVFTSATKTMNDKAKGDDVFRAQVSIIEGKVSDLAGVRAISTPETYTQNVQLFLSTKDRANQTATEKATGDIITSFAGVKGKTADGSVTQTDLDQAKAILAQKRGEFGSSPTTLKALDDEYVGLVQAAKTVWSGQVIGGLLDDIKKNPGAYSISSIYGDKRLTPEAKATAYSAWDTATGKAEAKSKTDTESTWTRGASERLSNLKRLSRGEKTVEENSPVLSYKWLKDNEANIPPSVFASMNEALDTIGATDAAGAQYLYIYTQIEQSTLDPVAQREAIVKAKIPFTMQTDLIGRLEARTSGDLYGKFMDDARAGRNRDAAIPANLTPERQESIKKERVARRSRDTLYKIINGESVVIDEDLPDRAELLKIQRDEGKSDTAVPVFDAVYALSEASTETDFVKAETLLSNNQKKIGNETYTRLSAQLSTTRDRARAFRKQAQETALGKESAERLSTLKSKLAGKEIPLGAPMLTQDWLTANKASMSQGDYESALASLSDIEAKDATGQKYLRLYGLIESGVAVPETVRAEILADKTMPTPLQTDLLGRLTAQQENSTFAVLMNQAEKGEDVTIPQNMPVSQQSAIKEASNRAWYRKNLIAVLEGKEVTIDRSRPGAEDLVKIIEERKTSAEAGDIGAEIFALTETSSAAQIDQAQAKLSAAKARIGGQTFASLSGQLSQVREKVTAYRNREDEAGLTAAILRGETPPIPATLSPEAKTRLASLAREYSTGFVAAGLSDSILNLSGYSTPEEFAAAEKALSDKRTELVASAPNAYGSFVSAIAKAKGERDAIGKDAELAKLEGDILSGKTDVVIPTRLSSGAQSHLRGLVREQTGNATASEINSVALTLGNTSSPEAIAAAKKFLTDNKSRLLLTAPATHDAAVRHIAGIEAAQQTDLVTDTLSKQSFNLSKMVLGEAIPEGQTVLTEASIDASSASADTKEAYRKMLTSAMKALRDQGKSESFTKAFGEIMKGKLSGDDILTSKTIDVADKPQLYTMWAQLDDSNRKKAAASELGKLTARLTIARKEARGVPLAEGEVPLTLEDLNNEDLNTRYPDAMDALRRNVQDLDVAMIEDDLQAWILNFDRNGYASGSVDQAAYNSVSRSIEEAYIPPERRNALMAALDNSKKNIEGHIRMMEDRAKAQDREDTADLDRISRKERENIEANNRTSASTIVKNFDASIANPATKAEAVAAILAVFDQDSAAAASFIRSLEVKWETVTDAAALSQENQAQNSYEEAVRRATQEGYSPNPLVTPLDSEYIKKIFPADTEFGLKSRKYWTDQVNELKASSEAIELQTKPIYDALTAARSNAWAAITGISFNKDAPVLSLDFINKYSGKLSSKALDAFRADADQVNRAAAESAAAAERKAAGLSPDEMAKARGNTALGVVRMVSNAIKNQPKSFGVPQDVVIPDMGPLPATPGTFDMVLRKYSTDLIAADKYDEAVTMLDDVATYEDPKFDSLKTERARLIKSRQWNDQLQQWLDIQTRNRPNMNADEVEKLVKAMGPKAVTIKVEKEWSFMKGRADVSESFLRAASQGEFDTYMSVSNGGTPTPTHPAFKEKAVAFQKRLMTEINTISRSTAKPGLKEGSNASVSYSPDGVPFIKQTGPAASQSFPGADSVEWHLAFYGEDALVSRKIHTKAGSVLQTWVSWEKESGAATAGRWVDVEAYKDMEGMTRYQKSKKQLTIDKNKKIEEIAPPTPEAYFSSPDTNWRAP